MFFWSSIVFNNFLFAYSRTKLETLAGKNITYLPHYSNYLEDTQTAYNDHHGSRNVEECRLNYEER